MHESEKYYFLFLQPVRIRNSRTIEASHCTDGVERQTRHQRG